MMAISQIIFSQYQIWVTSEKQSFVFVEKQLNDENHRAGTHRVKMGDDSVAKNTPNTPKSIWQICPMGPKVCEIIEKKVSSGVRIPWYVAWCQRPPPSSFSKSDTYNNNSLVCKLFDTKKTTDFFCHLFPFGLDYKFVTKLLVHLKEKNVFLTVKNNKFWPWDRPEDSNSSNLSNQIEVWKKGVSLQSTLGK